MIKTITRRILHLTRTRPLLERWREFRNFRGVLQYEAPVLQDALGVRFILYPWDRPYLQSLIDRVADLTQLSAMSHLVHAGDTAFDVGAHVGEFSVLLSRLCGPAGNVWSFEPVPQSYWRLREALALNRCENVTATQRAICDKTGMVRMNLFEPQFSAWNTLGMPSMLTPAGDRVSPAQSVEVQGHTLDEFCDAEQIERIHFLKVDVEGFEEMVFRGAERLLREHRVDYVCFEISREPLKGAGLDSRKVFEALETHGYFAYCFDESAGQFKGPIEDSSEYWANFYASWRDLSKMDGMSQFDSKRVAQLKGVSR
jgi:FkbM family methyltransferase